MTNQQDNGPTIAASPDAVSADWMTQVLRRSGHLPKHVSVIGIESRSVGNGLLGDSACFNLSHDHEVPAAPASLVGKFASQDPTSIATASFTQIYINEVSFYRDVAPTVAIRTPKVYFAEVNPQTHQFTLLMEDLAPARGGNQLEGCSIEDCTIAMLQAAALHGPRWNDPTLSDLPWTHARPAIDQQVAAMLPSVSEAFEKIYGEMLSPKHIDVIRWLAPRYGHMLADRSGPQTVQHSDYRLDNMLFDIHGQPGTMATLDWQTVKVGPGLWDAAYFLGGSLPLEMRRASEEQLVKTYHEALLSYGVRDYAWNDCWRDYQRSTFLGVFTSVFAAVRVQRTERSDILFTKMLSDHAQQVLDLGSMAFWE